MKQGHMIRRFLILLFFLIAKGAYFPLLAEEAHIQQNNAETNQTSTILDSSEKKPNKDEKLLYKEPNIQGMMLPPPQANTSPPPREPNLPEVANRVSHTTQNDSPIAQCNSQIMQNSRKLYDASLKEINNINNYVGFGILIAIFFMEAKFRIRKKCLIIFSSSLSIFSLFLNYVGCAYLLQASESLIQKGNTKVLDADYTEMAIRSSDLFVLIRVILVLAVVIFCILAYQYLFYTYPNDKQKFNHYNSLKKAPNP